MNLKELEQKVENLQEKVRTLEDIEQIKILQSAYGYYLDNQMCDELADLFADDAITEFGPGINKGKEKIRNSFRASMFKRDDGTRRLFVHLQVQGVVHIDQSGKTAKGRWQMYGLSTDYLGKPPGELQPMIGHGVYENEYIKENGIWKFKKITYNTSFSCTLQDGWVKGTSESSTETGIAPDVMRDIGDRTWRSGYKVPCHFKNPVTGR